MPDPFEQADEDEKPAGVSDDQGEYRVGGSCKAFWAWLQRGCTTVDRTHTGE